MLTSGSRLGSYEVIALLVTWVRALESTPEGDLRVVLRSGKKIPVSRRRRAAVMAALRLLAS